MIEDNDKVVIKVVKTPLASERKEKKQKRIKTIIIIALCVFLLLGGFVVGLFSNRIIHPSYDMEANTTLGEIEFILDKYWLYSYDYEDFIDEIENKAFYGMTYFNEDPYTTYMSNDESNNFVTNINMNYVGVGLQYESINGINTIKKIFKDSPAEIAGLEVGDVILAVDDTLIESLDTDEIKTLVVGEAGTQVTFLVRRGNEEKRITCVREKVDSSVYAYAQDDYVVLELLSFGIETAQNTMKYLDGYTDYDKILIDLRDNTGGYQTSVEEIAGLFIGNEQVYMRQVDKDGNEYVDYTDCAKTYDNFKKIVILTNKNTASAAEVLTICLKEQFPDATIVGETTFGKGVVQSTFTLLSGDSLKVTTTKWLSPNGVWINGEGIKPDVEVRLHDVMYENYYILPENQDFCYDTVSNYVRLAQLSLDYLGYDINRFDGYFDSEFEEELMKYQADSDLEVTGILNSGTYNALYFDMLRASTESFNDVQKVKAIEILHN